MVTHCHRSGQLKWQKNRLKHSSFSLKKIHIFYDLKFVRNLPSLPTFSSKNSKNSTNSVWRYLIKIYLSWWKKLQELTLNAIAPFVNISLIQTAFKRWFESWNKVFFCYSEQVRYTSRYEYSRILETFQNSEFFGYADEEKLIIFIISILVHFMLNMFLCKYAE